MIDNKTTLVDTTSIKTMFDGLKNKEIINLSNLDTSKLTDISEILCNYKSLVTLDISSFNFSNIVDQDSIFFFLSGCNSLKNLQFGKHLKTSVDLSFSKELSHESVLSILNGLDEASNINYAALNEKTCKLLNNKDIEIATDKNWKILSSTITKHKEFGCEISYRKIN